MKIIMYKKGQHLTFRLVWIIVLVSFSFLRTAQAKEFSKYYMGNVLVRESDLIDISVFNNDVVINTTDEQTASFKLNLIIDLQNGDDELANEILENLQYRIIKENDSIKMNFLWPFQYYQSNYFLLFAPKTKFSLPGGKKFELKGNISAKMSLEINIPKKNSIKINGNHSTIKLGHLNNSADISLNQSKLYTNDIGKLKLDASFSDINVGNIKQNVSLMLRQSQFSGLTLSDIDANLTFSTVDISECLNALFHYISQSTFKSEIANDIEVSSSHFSNFDIKSAKSMTIQYGEHGKISIERVNYFDLKNGLFIKLALGEIKESAIINTKNSNMILGNLHTDIDNVVINNEFASLTIGTEKIENFDLHFNNNSFSTIEKPENIIKKSDNYYVKRTSSKDIKNIEISCPNCTLSIK